MSKFKKFILPTLLLTLAMGAEITGIIFCGKMLPDYKNEIFTEEKKNITQLIFVDDGDNSRFYPWLSYREDELISAPSYITSHIYDQSLDMFANSLGDDRYNYDDEALKKIMLENINEMIFYVIQTLDINNIPKENTDFSQNVEFDNNASIMHIKDFKYTNQNNKTKILDLVVKLGDNSILYFRVRSENPPKPDSQEINQKSKEISEDVCSAIDYLTKSMESQYSELALTDMYFSEQNEYEEDVAEQPLESNKIYDYISSIYMPEMYVDNGNYVFSTIADDKFAFPIRVVISSMISNSQYTVFSNGDELILVLSGNDNTSKYSDTILYYSISDKKFTGFSMKSTF